MWLLVGEARRTVGLHPYLACLPAPLPRSFELPARLVPMLADAEAAQGSRDQRRYVARDLMNVVTADDAEAPGPQNRA